MKRVSTTGELFRGRDLRIGLASTIIYCAIVCVTHALASNSIGLTPIWPANAVLVACLMRQQRPRWLTISAGCMAANLGANFILREPWSAPLLFGLANVVEILIAARLLRWMLPDGEALNSQAALARFCTVSVIAPALGALIGAATTTLLFGESFPGAYRLWAFSGALGLLIYTPLFLAVMGGNYLRGCREQHWQRRAETLVLLALTGVTAWLSFFVLKLPVLFLMFAPVMVVTVRTGRLGAILAVGLVAIMGGIATMQGLGPVAALSPDRAWQALMLQTYLAVLLVSSLLVAADITARHELTERLAERERQLTHRAATDSLTGLANRAAFIERARTELAARGDHNVSLVMVDVDHFKAVNDTWGHPAGDHALMHLARIFRRHLRAQDFVGRIGGDEFVLLLPDVDGAAAESLCLRLQTGVRRSALRLDDGTRLMLSVSCGVASAAPGDSLEDLVRKGDRALYTAKQAGRDLVRQFA